jgi:hypothetical protein
MTLDPETRAYIQSESEFSHARLRGFLDLVMAFITGHDRHLLSFNEVVEKLRLKQAIYRGLQDIPLENIAGSTGRYEDFTRHFLPRAGNRRDKERWRKLYTLAVTGKGFPPIEAYKIDQVYFVRDGNHRVSVAKELGWETIQAYVTELPSPISLEPDVKTDELLIKEECAYFLEQTHLDQNRPDSKQHIDFTVPGGYKSLLHDIELHRYLMAKVNKNGSGEKIPIPLPAAAADWYDRVYLPLIETIRQMDIIKHFPGRSESDLYLWLIEHQTELREQHELVESDLSEAVREFLRFVEEEEEGSRE